MCSVSCDNERASGGLNNEEALMRDSRVEVGVEEIHNELDPFHSGVEGQSPVVEVLQPIVSIVASGQFL